jgi:hypothetical protein
MLTGRESVPLLNADEVEKKASSGLRLPPYLFVSLLLGSILWWQFRGLEGLRMCHPRLPAINKDLDVHQRHLWSGNRDSTSSEARKRGSGEDPPGSTMTY